MPSIASSKTSTSGWRKWVNDRLEQGATILNFTSTGIDDNATAERLQIANGAITLGASNTSSYDLFRVLDTGSLTISGGSSAILGASMIVRGSNHSSQGGDLLLRSSNNVFLEWDESEGAFEIRTGVGSKTAALIIPADGQLILPLGQINFPDTQNASSDVNSLDDYEEGTWTVTLSDESANNSATTITGYYTKIGNQVTVSIGNIANISTVGMTGGEQLRISLPETSSATTGSTTGSVVYDNIDNPGTNGTRPSLAVKLGTNAGYFNLSACGDSVGDATVLVNDITTGTTDILRISLTYFV